MTTTDFGILQLKQECDQERWVVRNTDEKEDETRDPKELISEAGTTRSHSV